MFGTKEKQPETQKEEDKGVEKRELENICQAYQSQSQEDNNISETAQEYDDAKEYKSNWVLCFCGFLIAFMLFGVQCSFGVSFDRFLMEFKQSKSQTAWVGSLFSLTFNVFSPLSSALCERFGAHVTISIGGLICFSSFMFTSIVPELGYMYFTYGFLFGIGSILAFTPAVLTIGGSFGKRKSIALSLMSVGINVGTMSLGILMSTLFNFYNWRITYRIVGPMCLCIVICSFAFRPSRCLPHVKAIGSKKPVWTSFKACFGKDLFKNKNFIAYTIAMLFIAFGIYIPHTFLVRYARELGISDNKAAGLYIYLSCSAVAGKIIFGYIADMKGVNKIALYQSGIFISGLTAILCSLGSSYLSLVFFTVIYGFMDAAMLGINVVCLMEMVEPSDVCRAFGTSNFIQGLLYMLGPPVTGYFIDWRATSRPMFYFAGVPLIIGAIILFYVIFHWRRNQVKRKSDTLEITCDLDPIFYIYAGY